MFRIGDKVRHKMTGIKGKVIGYGNRETSAGRYITTLKVELRSQGSMTPVAEDLCDRWKIWYDRKLACSLPFPPKLSKQAIKALQN